MVRIGPIQGDVCLILTPKYLWQRWAIFNVILELIIWFVKDLLTYPEAHLLVCFLSACLVTTLLLCLFFHTDSPVSGCSFSLSPQIWTRILFLVYLCGWLSLFFVKTLDYLTAFSFCGLTYEKTHGKTMTPLLCLLSSCSWVAGKKSSKATQTACADWQSPASAGGVLLSPCPA